MTDLNCDSGHKNTDMIQLYRIKHTHTSTSKTEEIWVRSVDVIIINIPVVLVLQNAKTLGGTGKGYMVSPCSILTVACEISNYLNIISIKYISWTNALFFVGTKYFA